MPPYSPNDSMIGPVVAAIANLIATQVQGVSVVYQKVPDSAPEDGSVLIPLTGFRIVEDTNGKLKVRLGFGIRHFIVRGELPDNIQTAYSYLVPYLQVFSSWANQTLGGLAREMTPSAGGVTQFVENGQAFVALILNLDVIVDLNIPTA